MTRRKSRVSQDTYNYTLYRDNGLYRENVYEGITNDPERRMREHKNAGKNFDNYEVSRARSRGRAERDETEAIHRHQDNDLFGQAPRYNKAKVRRNSGFGGLF